MVGYPCLATNIVEVTFGPSTMEWIYKEVGMSRFVQQVTNYVCYFFIFHDNDLIIRPAFMAGIVCDILVMTCNITFLHCVVMSGGNRIRNYNTSANQDFELHSV